MRASTITSRRMSAEEFGDWVHQPENRNKWFELVRGEVIELPPPFKRHGYVSVNIGRILGNYTFQQGKGYVTVVWLVDPEARTVLVYHARKIQRMLELDQELKEPELLPGFSCRVSDFFRLPGDRSKSRPGTGKKPKRS